jgi:hypothetical protein
MGLLFKNMSLSEFRPTKICHLWKFSLDELFFDHPVDPEDFIGK